MMADGVVVEEEEMRGLLLTRSLHSVSKSELEGVHCGKQSRGACWRCVTRCQQLHDCTHTHLSTDCCVHRSWTMMVRTRAPRRVRMKGSS